MLHKNENRNPDNTIETRNQPQQMFRGIQSDFEHLGAPDAPYLDLTTPTFGDATLANGQVLVRSRQSISWLKIEGQDRDSRQLTQPAQHDRAPPQ